MFTPLLPFLAQAGTATAAPHPVGPPLPDTGTQITVLAVLFLVGALLQIVGNWIASKVLVPDDSEFSKAAKLWAMTLAGFVGAGVLTGAVIAAATAMGGLPWVTVLALIGFALLAVYVIFATPMKVYKITFLRSLAFVVLAFVVVCLGQVGAAAALPLVLKGTDTGATLRALTNPDPAAQNANLAWLRRTVPSFAASLDMADAAIAADRSKSIPVRQAALQRMRDVLETRRQSLNPKDQAATADYKRDAQKYSELYREVDAEAAKARAAAAAAH